MGPLKTPVTCKAQGMTYSVSCVCVCVPVKQTKQTVCCVSCCVAECDAVQESLDHLIHKWFDL